MLLQEIRIQLSKVLVLRDAFSGKPVVNAVQIEDMRGRKTTVRRDGYCLFFGAGQDAFDITITSPIYRKQELRLYPDGGETEEEVLLYPSRAYPVSPGSTVVYGTVPRQTELMVYLEESDRECRLLQDYQKGDPQISVYMRGGVNQEKRDWYIWEKEKEEGEFFQVQKRTGETETYELLSPLKEDYRKKNALLYPAWKCPADENGEVYLVFDHLKEKSYGLHYVYTGKTEEVCGKTEIFGGRQNVHRF